MKRTLTLMFLAMVFLLPPVAAQQYSNQLKKELIDLPGWKGADADGADMIFNQMKLITASREYTKGDAQVTVGILITNTGTQAGKIPTVLYEDEDGFAKTQKIKGYDAYVVYDKKEHNGSIIVILLNDPIAMLVTLNYEKIGWQEAVDLMKKFDLDAMKKVAESLK